MLYYIYDSNQSVLNSQTQLPSSTFPTFSQQPNTAQRKIEKKSRYLEDSPVNRGLNL